MNHWKILWKTISTLLTLLVLFFLLLIIMSANWFINNFGGVAFATVVYQLFSPMKGTASGIVSDYLQLCLYPSAYWSVFFVFLMTVYDTTLKKLVLVFEIHIPNKVFHFKIGNTFRLISKIIILGSGFVIMCYIIRNRAVVTGVPEYIDSLTHSSNLYESEYVDPNEVSFEFSEHRNLLLIYMESMETTYASTDVGGGKPVNYIPELTLLAQNNLNFSNDEDLGGAASYPNTGWTMAGILASYSGVNYKIPVEGNSAGDYETFLPGLTTMGDILYDAGYRNYFMCGSDAEFAGRADFFNQHGYFHILDYYTAIRDGIIPEGYKEFWGMEDKYLYEYAKRALTEISASDEPFNFTMLTVDTHHPDGYICSLCGNEYSQRFANVISCADTQVREFTDWAAEQNWFENTTIVIVGDHLSMNADFWDDIGDYDRRVYNCFINLPKGLSVNQTMNREFTYMDMFPTVLAAMGVKIEGERLGLGTNLFSDKPTLAEEFGKKNLANELGRYSHYYFQNFIEGR